MSDTPITDLNTWTTICGNLKGAHSENEDELYVPVSVSKKLERELNAARQITGETSDGYHSFNELYEHRHALFLALLSIKATGGWMSKKHDDGSEMDGWFIAGAQGWNGDISYHLPMRLWDACVKTGAEVLEKAPKWDGHTSKDVIDRLMKYATL